MRILKTILIATLFALTLSGYSQDKNAFSIIQITDPQFGFLEDNKGFSQETKLFEKAISEVNRLHPDIVVFTGDLVNKREDKSQIDEFRRIVSNIDKGIKVLYSPGNHDLGSNPGKKEIDEFKKFFGPDRFSVKYRNTRLIGLNSSLIRNNTPELEQEQISWLEKQLSKSKRSDHIILFTHYSFFINSPAEPEAYFNITPATRAKYFNLFKKSGVDAIFSGHLHNNGYGKDGDIEMITTSAVGKPLGKAPSGFRIIKVYPDRIENKYYGLDDIPDSIF